MTAPERVGLNADTFCENMNSLISGFVQSDDKENLREIGIDILLKINSMLSIIRKKLDYKQEQVF